ncbi:MAG: tripartite tricarboxylate transporter substrate binding protein [Burkholderiales bacterium]|nr:tripartite tricarboxylate transporter substrate binding protein [Burkholderiales bacterium]
MRTSTPMARGPGTGPARIALAAALLFPGAALAQSPATYPQRPVRLVAPVPPGSGVDTFTRATVQKLTEAWGQQVIVDNRPGANGIIAVEQVTRSKPDGHTMLVAFTSLLAINPHVHKALPYDVERDLLPVMQTVTNTIALTVHPQLPARTPKELVALARARPNEVLYGSAGVGNVSHLAAELLAAETGIQVTHVPYKGATPAIQETISGQVAFSFPILAAVSGHVRSGRLRLLATCGEKRSSQFPETPTLVESGYPRMIVTGWGGYMAPAGTPREIVAAFQRDAARVIQGAEMRERLTALGTEPDVSTPGEFAAFIRAESDKWARVAKRAGVYRSQ